MTAVAGPGEVRRLVSPAAAELAAWCSVQDELRTTLHCCERLVGELTAPGGDAPDPRTRASARVVVEALWSLALACYGRAFAATGGDGSPLLTPDDVAATVGATEAVEWHTVLLRLRDHHGDPVDNPRERFSVGVAQDDDGRAAGVAVTAATQPPVDVVTVRQTGAVAFALAELVETRIAGQQASVLAGLSGASRADLDALETLALDAEDGG